MVFTVTLIGVLSLVIAPAVVSAQTTQTPSTSVEPSPVAWQYGAFTDVGRLFSSTSPSNHLFRNRGTTPRFAGAALKGRTW
jgi:hypothetical protein